jgi:hypothetical protein
MIKGSVLRRKWRGRKIRHVECGLHASLRNPAYLERAMQSVESSRLLMLSAQMGWDDERPFGEGALEKVLDLLVSSFHYVFLEIGERADPLTQ